jgi:hypothetical protein
MRDNMNKWFYINITIFLFALWKGIIMYLPYVKAAVLFALIGLFFILVNWNMHGMFLQIRTIQDRQHKIRIAKVAKKIMPFHIWIGMSGFILIIIHACFIIHLYGFHWHNLKIISGLVALTAFACHVTTGLLRKVKPSGKRRRAHIRTAFILIFTVVVHIILQIA